MPGSISPNLPTGGDELAVSDSKIRGSLITLRDELNALLDGNNQIPTATLAADSVTAAKIAADAVGSSEIAENAVGSSEIAADAVGTSELANDAVETANVKDAAVTDAKLSSPIIRGQVQSNGTIEAGTGFTISQTGTGVYTVKLTTELTSVGIMQVTLVGLLGSCRIAALAGKKEFKVEVINTALAAADSAFNFSIQKA